MNAMSHPSTIGLRLAAALLLVAAFLFASACDTDDTFDTERLDGTYEFTEFFFETPRGVANVDILAALDTGVTELDIFANRRYTLVVQFSGESRNQFAGDYEIGSDRLTLDLSNLGDIRRRLLLPEDQRLNILDDGDRLRISEERQNVALGDFDPEEFGDTVSSGTMVIELVKQ